MIGAWLLAVVLSGGWTADGVPVEVPHTWNAVDAADGAAQRYDHAGESIRSDSYRRQRVVYRRSLPDGNGERAFVRVNGASQTAVVTVNGRELFTHRGAFTPFVVEVTEAMKPRDNVLEIAVDNFANPDIPPVHADFSLFGGLYRPVEFFRGTGPVRPSAKPWPLPEKIRGVNRHQDFKGKGWALSPEDEARDVALMKEMGVNLVRTAHYPASENFYSLCDRAGIAVISEASAVDFVTDSAAFRTNYLGGIREMVEAYRHHPCIVAWGLFNEMASDEKTAAPIVAEGAKLLRALDPSRPVYGVADIWNCGKRELQSHVDLLGFNVYPGWYSGNATDIVENVNRCFALSGRTRGFIAEYGAGGSPNHHDLSGRRPGASYVRFHPEEYQALVHEIEYRAIAADPRLRGGIVWCFADFASDVRNEGEAPGINDKGLVTYDRAVKKDAFHFYQANWTDTPVLHIVGSRAATIAAEPFDLRVYSNVGEVRAFLNGSDLGVQRPDAVKVAVFPALRLNPGTNEIVVRAGTRERRWRVTRAMTSVCPEDGGAELKGNPARGAAPGGWVVFKPEGLPDWHGDAGFHSSLWELSRFSGGRKENGRPPKPERVGTKDLPITDAMKRDARRFLSETREKGGSLIVRLGYTWSDEKGCEPADFAILLGHVRDLAGIMADFPDVIVGVEAGVAGPWGEMHSSAYCEKEPMVKILTAYLENLAPTTPLLVRAPRYLKFMDFNPRLGMYNDGYLGTWWDYGTWAGEFTRERGCEILKPRGKVPYGGEMAYVSREFLDGNRHRCRDLWETNSWNIVRDWYDCHLTYLRNLGEKGHTLATYLKEIPFDSRKWAFPGMPRLAEYDGRTMSEFVRDHMGYRFVVRALRPVSDPVRGRTARLELAIENTGFGSLLVPVETSLVFGSGPAAVVVPVKLPLESIPGGATKTLAADFAVPENLPAGWIAFALGVRSGRIPLALANRGMWDAQTGVNRLGEIEIKKPSK